MDNRGILLKNIGNYVILGSIALVIVADLGNKNGGTFIFLLLLVLGFLCVLAGEAVMNPFDMGDDAVGEMEDVDSLAIEQESPSPTEKSGSFYKEDEDSGGFY